jgi:dipeptidase
MFDVYCSRRVWRIFSLVAPSLKLSPNSTTMELPFSVKAERKLTPEDIMGFNRDHYEGKKKKKSSIVFSYIYIFMFNLFVCLFVV